MKSIKYMLLIVISLFTFYISDKLLIIVENMSPIMKEINKYDEIVELPVNSIVEDNSIIIGKSGKNINKRESYIKMNEFKNFNETFFVYDYIKPDISIKDNMDKNIIGSTNSNIVSIIVDTNRYDTYLNEKKIFHTKIITDKKDFVKKDNIEYINGLSDEDDAKKLNMYLKRKKEQNNMCLVGTSSIVFCKKNKFYLISPKVEIYKSNLASIKTKIKGGNIIYIHDDLSLNEFEYIINEINYKALKIEKLSELIKE